MFLVIILYYALFFPIVPYDNIMCRMDLIYSVVNDGTLSIDKYASNTGDKAVYNQHYYADKAIGASLLGIPVYLPFKLIALIFDLHPMHPLGIYLVTLIAIGVPSAYMALILRRLLVEYGMDEANATSMVLFYAFGTMALPYSTAFYGHQLSAALMLSAFYLASLLIKEKIDSRFAYLLGFLLAYSVITEYPSVIVGFIISLWCTISWRARLDKVIPMIIGALPWLLVLLAYNYACFEDPFTLAYSYKALPDFQRIHSQGIFGISMFSFKAFYKLMVSPAKGLFFFSPFLLLGLLGLIKGVLKKECGKEPVSGGNYLFPLIVIVAYTFFGASFVDYDGGWTFGPRHLVPMVPFLVLGFAALRLNKRWLSVLLYSLGLMSILIFALGTISSMHFPLPFDAPIVEFAWEVLKEGYISSAFAIFGSKGAILGLSLVGFYLIFIFSLIVKYKQGYLEKRIIIPIAITLFFGYMELNMMLGGSPTAAKYTELGRVYMYNNLYAAAARAYEKSMQLQPDDPLLYGRYGEACEAAGNQPEALRAYLAMAKSIDVTKDPYLMGKIFQISLQLGQVSIAEDYLDKLQRLLPDDPQVLFGKAQILLLRDDVSGAKEILQRLLEQGKLARYPDGFMAQIEAQLKEVERAKAMLGTNDER